MFVSRNKKIVRMVRQSCGIAIFSHTSNPEPVLALLKSHLPYSLPLFRRLQFMSIPGGSTPSSHILCSFPLEPEKGEVEGEGKRDGNEAFTVAYLDLSRGPETEMWMYSSFEHPSHNSPAATTECLKQVLAVLKHVGGLVKDWEKELEERGEGEGGKRNTPGVVLCGTLYDEIFRFLDNERALGSSREVVVGASPENLKFMFTKDKLPVQKELPDGFEWGIVGVEDLELVLRRTGVPRKVRTMKLLPSAAVRVAGSGELVSWGFLGPDASLTSLHVEEEHRGKGLAKAVALKLFHERLHMFGAEEYAHADVEVRNKASQGVCKSIGGEVMWSDYWAWIDLVALEEVVFDAHAEHTTSTSTLTDRINGRYSIRGSNLMNQLRGILEAQESRSLDPVEDT